MRKPIIAGAVLAVTSVLILAALNVNYLVRRNKDYLLGRLAQEFGRKISADEIEVTFKPLGARFVNLAIADPPAFSADDFVRAKNFQVELRLLPLLIGQLRVAKVVLESPVVTIVRGTDGKYNFESPTSVENGAGNRTDRSKPPSDGNRDGELFLITSLNISDGTLRYRDLNSGGELTVTQINLKVSDIERDEPVEIQLDAAVMTAKTNLKFNSRVGPIAGILDYRDFPVDGNIDADNLDLGKVNRALPQFRKALPRHLRFDGIYDIKDLKFKGTWHNLSLKGAISGTDASVRFE